MRRRDITTALVSSATAAAVMPELAQARQLTAASYPRTSAEIAAGVTPTNTAHVAGHVYRYGTNTTPGKTDMTSAINTAARVCRQGNYPLQLPGETLLVSAALDFSRLCVVGLGSPFGGPSLIQASSRQFDVVTTTGESTFYNFNVDGGNPHKAPGLDGDNFSLRAAKPAHPYLVSFVNVGSTNAKARGCYIERGGYTSFFHFHCLNAGLHALECFGDPDDMCTTIRDYGSSQFGGTPNGYGIKLTECACCAFRDSILEETQGIQLNGVNNRAITFDGVYQEWTSGGQFITHNGSAGIGLVVRGCFGGNTTIPFLKNWHDVYFQGNSNLDTGAVPLANRILQCDGGEQFVSATSDLTAASLTLGAGTYLVFGTLQSRVARGKGLLSQLACNISTDAAASGMANATSAAAFVTGADQRSQQAASGSGDLRVNCFTILQLTSASPIYLRAHIAVRGTVTIGCHGFLNAVLFQ
jgi:hypothetical protein